MALAAPAAQPYELAMQKGNRQVTTYLTPKPGQEDSTMWATFTQVWDMYLEMGEIGYVGNYPHNWQVTQWRTTATGATVSIMPCVPNCATRHYNMVVDQADSAYLVAR